jgi:myosin heavy chain 1/2/3/4/8/13/7B/15
MTFKEKLYSTHLGKHPSFGKPKPKKGVGEDKQPHFDLHHYAGTVSYSVAGWLEKNKDPINMSAAALLKASKDNKLLNLLFADIGAEEASSGGGGKKGKSASQQTISSGHRVNNFIYFLKDY